MPNHKSAFKRARQNLKRRARNRAGKSALRTELKKVRSALDANDPAAAAEALPGAVRALAKAAGKGLIPDGQASRKISRLTRAVNKISG